MIAAFGVLTLALAMEWGGRRTTVWYDDLLTIVAAAAAAVAAFVAARRDRRDVHSFWMLLGVALTCWTAGEVAWGYYELILGRDVPFPSAADIGYAAAVPLAAAALLTLPVMRARGAQRVRFVLDGLIAVSGSLFIAWVVLLGPLYEQRQGTPVQMLLVLGYPLGDVLVITLAAIALGRARSRGGALPLVVAGLAAVTAADAGYAYLTQIRDYDTGSVIDALWIAGYAALAIAATRPMLAPPVGDERLSVTTSLLPYAPVMVGLAIASERVIRTGGLDRPLWFLGMTTVILVIVRQVLAIVDNVALTKTLEGRVRSRTQDLARERERLSALLDHSSDLTLVADMAGIVTFVAGGIHHPLAVDAPRVIGRPLASLVHPDDRASMAGALLKAASATTNTVRSDWRMPGPAGDWRSFEVVVSNASRIALIEGVVVNARDVTDRRHLEDELRHQALHDPLTGLANRVLFADRVDHAVVRSDRTNGAPAILFLDLDDFKAINDSAGHSAGDMLLRETAQRIVAAVRPSDTVARMGGDEFAVLLERIEHQDDPTMIAQRVQEAIGRPTSIETRTIIPRVSIGIAVTDVDGSSSDDLLRHADVAMYIAKAAGKGAIRKYDASVGSSIVDQLALEAELPAAIANGELVVFYQPLVELTTHRVVGVEALVRWAHPERGIVSPDQFIPAAERCGTIVDIGNIVLLRACADGRRWLDAQPDLEVSVNVSARQLSRPSFPDEVAQTLQTTGFPAGNLVLEITETVLIDDGAAVTTALEALAELGVRLAIDDFGTGYSSLSYLSHLPVHVLKIDRSFITALGRGSRETAVISTIVRLARDLELDTIAEGVESEDVAEALTSVGCHLAQGFLYARPLPMAEVDQLLAGPAYLGATVA